MSLLAIDTCLAACQAAVISDGVALASLSEPMARGHQERLGPMVREAMDQAGLRFSELDRIAVTVGPGSFTGLRVGLAFAKGLALALDIPCTGVGTLAALAAGAAGRRAAVI
ncbi:MAG: tRNA (adenosine(37)-N6)-threonylcarbamoyltransferase complex dimerization subunit type 1 TsaB, partial [Caulobacteraceae bacterium]